MRTSAAEPRVNFSLAGPIYVGIRRVGKIERLARDKWQLVLPGLFTENYSTRRLAREAARAAIATTRL